MITVPQHIQCRYLKCSVSNETWRTAQLKGFDDKTSDVHLEAKNSLIPELSESITELLIVIFSRWNKIYPILVNIKPELKYLSESERNYLNW